MMENTKEETNIWKNENAYIFINSSLKKTVELKIISENVNTATVLPKIQEFKGKILSVEDINKIINDAKEEELYPIVILTIYTGMRKGEVMALKWENINWEDKELYIEGSLCSIPKETNQDGKNRYEYKILSPKTEKSRRTVPLVDTALEALVIQKQRQEEIKRKYRLIYNDEGFVW